MMQRRLIISMTFALGVAGGFASAPPGPMRGQSSESGSGAGAASGSVAAAATFAQQVDLAPLARVAAYTNGRVKSLESFTRTQMQFVSGSRQINGQTPMFTYFDLMLRPDAYADQDIVFFKNKLMRAQVARALHTSKVEGFDALREERFMTTGLLAATLVSQPAVIDLLSDLSRNVLTNAKLVDAISNAMGVMNPEVLRQNLRLVAPPGGGFDDPWLPIDAVRDPTLMGADPNAALDADLRNAIATQWEAFTKAWRDQNAQAVNSAVGQLADLLPRVNPQVYPAAERLTWESWYFRSYNMTWVWILYGLAMIPLLLGVVFRWPAAHWIGLLLFLVALGAHTSAVGLRWYVAQRWPNSNMFEAITTAAWFGACLALLLEMCVLRKPMRGLFALGASIAGMTAMMAVKLFPLSLSPEIHNMMPVLNDLWLYIHTNVIIFSYCLIFIAAVTAALYLAYRGVLALRGRSGAAEYARVGGAGSLILTRPDGSSYIDEKRSSFGQILDGTTMVVMELSFILLWAGIVMGAIWADHSWGRPWGWDPKEVFALNTFLVFLVLVHGRLKVKDKGLWTAALALVGAGVMLFNWIIINFAISGLHSYA
jgi:cytochrome c-type biogenesis protein CcsB